MVTMACKVRFLSKLSFGMALNTGALAAAQSFVQKSFFSQAIHDTFSLFAWRKFDS
jgi:hypothetical protein